MSCDESSCPGGNCPGCHNGRRWCRDPRCHPYCATCPMVEKYKTVMAVLTAFLAFFLLLAVFICYIFAVKDRPYVSLRMMSRGKVINE